MDEILTSDKKLSKKDIMEVNHRTSVEPLPLESTLVPRRWEKVQEEGEDYSGEEIRVYQLNVLCDFLAQQDCFTRLEHPTRVIDFEHRKHRLLADILRQDPHIICLQEVDHYFDWFLPELSKRGYQSTFTRKPLAKDGSCIFWKDDLFECKFTTSYQFVNPKYESVDNQLQIVAYLVQKQNVISSSSSSSRQGDGHLLVSTTHLKAAKDKTGEIIRTYQAKQCCQNLKEVASHLGDPPIVVAGDLNAAPFDKADYRATCVPMFVNEEFQSVYNISDPSIFTTWKFRARRGPGSESENKHMIDYIWYHDGKTKVQDGLPGTDSKIIPTSILSLPNEQELGDCGLPSFKHPSDHLSLGFGFVFKSEP